LSVMTPLFQEGLRGEGDRGKRGRGSGVERKKRERELGYDDAQLLAPGLVLRRGEGRGRAVDG